MNSMRQAKLQNWFWLGLTVALIAVVALLGPAERSLGSQVRVVYLHGAWVWTALAAFVASGAAGLVGFLGRRDSWHCWSRDLGRTGLFFWITYLPLSLWAMQTTWNGLFLSEPRWRLALVFSISGLLLQMGLSLLGSLRLTALGNMAFIGLLLYTLMRTENVMHPASPILTSDAWLIRIYFFGLLALTLLAAGQIAQVFRRFAGCHAQP
jgi:hypothetical protein